MRRTQQSVDRALLPVYQRIIEFYCPYVLVRCIRYTNNRRQAQQIGAYTLACACLAAQKVGNVVPGGRGAGEQGDTREGCEECGGAVNQLRPAAYHLRPSIRPRSSRWKGGSEPPRDEEHGDRTEEAATQDLAFTLGLTGGPQCGINKSRNVP